jgi:hypothetical protein
MGLMKQMYTTLGKQLEKCHPYHADQQEHVKHVSQHKFGTKLMAAAEDAMQGKLDAARGSAEGAAPDTDARTQTGFEMVFAKAARIELDLGQLEANYKKSLHTQVFDPISDIVEKELAPVAAERKLLDAAAQNAERARKKQWETSGKKPSEKEAAKDPAKVAAHAAKEEAATDLSESMATKLRAAEGVYSLALGKVMSQDKRLAEPLVNLVQEQLAYHRSAVMLLERALPNIMNHFDQLGAHAGPFGNCLPEKGVPLCILQCCAVVNRDGLDVEGIFRRAGAKSKMRNIQAKISNGTADFGTREGYEYDIHAIAGTIKKYLRELPEPLFTFPLYDQWTSALYIEDNDEKLYELQRLVESLPPGNKDTLKFLTQFFANVASHGEVNLMKESNLSLVIGPNLL